MVTHCRLWYERVLSDAKYWQWARLHVDQRRYPNQKKYLLNSRLRSLVPEIWFYRFADLDLAKSLLESIRDGVTPQLKKLTITVSSGWDLVNINPSLVSSAVLKLEECIIFSGGQHVKAIFKCYQAILTGIRDSTNSRLRHLHLDLGYGIHTVSPDLVAEAAMKLETLRAILSSPQLEAIITRLADTQDSRLRRLSVSGFCGVDISSLDPGIVAGALVKLEKVEEDLSCRLSDGQLSAFLYRIRDSPELRLSKLHLEGKNLSLLPTEVLVGAIQRLEEVKFSWGRMTAEQAMAVRTMVKEGRMGRIKKLELHRVSAGSKGSWSRVFLN